MLKGSACMYVYVYQISFYATESNTLNIILDDFKSM